MSELTLAFNSIARLIGGVVLIGTVGFLGGALLARHRIKHRALSSGTTIADLEAEILRLKHEHRLDDLQEQILSEFFGPGDLTNALASLVQRVRPPSLSGFACFVGTNTDDGYPTVASGLSKQTTGQLTIPREYINQLRTENPLVIPRMSDPQNLFGLLGETDREKSDQLVLTGINQGGKILGVLVTSSCWPAELPLADPLAFMRLIAQQLAERWHQKLAAEHQLTELRSAREMLEIREIIDSRIDDPVEAFSQFATRLGEMTGADRVAIYFIARRAGERLQPIVQCGNPLPPSVAADWTRHEQALAHVAIESQLGSLQDGAWLQSLQRESPITSAASAPIQVNGRVLGALCLTSKTPGYSLETRRRLIDFGASTLAHTLRRVFDEAAIRRQARHDHLTDLVNRRSFDAYLEAEVERIQHDESVACSLILADLDHFKSINDRFGHQAGDKVLRETARLMGEQVSQLRAGETSVVARYGGEEFAILLPNVGLAGAMRIAEGIRTAIASKTIRIQKEMFRITMSLGVAVCPLHADSVESLIAAADKCLYRAKASGRNRVCRPQESMMAQVVTADWPIA